MVATLIRLDFEVLLFSRKYSFPTFMTSCNHVMIGFHYRTNSLLVINETEETGGNFYEILVPKYSGGIIKAE